MSRAAARGAVSRRVTRPRGRAAAAPGPVGPDARGRLPRRLLPAFLLLPLLAPALAACAEEVPTGPAPVTEVGAEVPSPSGEVRAVLDTAGDAVGVVLRDRDGTDMWADDFPYTREDPPGLRWQTEGEDEVLWILPTDGTPSRITGGDGAWRKSEVPAEEDIPAEIRSWMP